MIKWRIEIRAGKLESLYSENSRSTWINSVVSYDRPLKIIAYYRHSLYNKGPFCSSAESSPVNHLLIGFYTNAKHPLQGVIKVRLLRYRRMPVRQLGCHYTGENRPLLGFCNRWKACQWNLLLLSSCFLPSLKMHSLWLSNINFFYSISLINTSPRWFISFRWWFSS